VSPALPEKRIFATLSSKRDTRGACESTTAHAYTHHGQAHVRARVYAYGIRKLYTESVNGSLSKSSICEVHERI